MNYTKKVLMISMAAIIGVVMIAPSVSADSPWNFLDIGKVHLFTSDPDTINAKFGAKAQIPTDGTEGAFGYGLITDAGLEAIMVTTSHAGVQDSEAQEDEFDAIFHNHYVALQDSGIGSGFCEGLEIRNITYEEPGSAYIDGTRANMEKVPYSFIGTDSLTGEELSFLSSETVTRAVSFTIEPILGLQNDILAVCINDVLDADAIEVRSADDKVPGNGPGPFLGEEPEPSIEPISFP